MGCKESRCINFSVKSLNNCKALSDINFRDRFGRPRDCPFMKTQMQYDREIEILNRRKK